MNSQMEQWGLLVGVLLPLVTAAVQQPRWTKTQRSVVAAVVSLVAGVVVVWVQGGFSHGLGDPVATVLVVLAASEAAYQKIWQPTRVAEAVERVTSPAGKVETADWE